MDIETWHTSDPLNCPAVRALNAVSGKWKPAILFLVGREPQRFGALQRALPEISHKTLTRQLRELEDDGIVKRRVFASVPPKTEYSLTPHGRKLGPIMQLLYEWGGGDDATKEVPVSA